MFCQSRVKEQVTHFQHFVSHCLMKKQSREGSKQTWKRYNYSSLCIAYVSIYAYELKPKQRTLRIPRLLQHEKQQSIQISCLVWIKRKQLFLFYKGLLKEGGGKKRKKKKTETKPKGAIPVGIHQPQVVGLKCESALRTRALASKPQHTFRCQL